MGLTLIGAPTNSFNPWRNKAITGDFFCHNYYTVWKTSDKIKTWKHVFISLGIRRSDKIQIIPIWNTSHNCQHSILFGFWKFYLEIGYAF